MSRGFTPSFLAGTTGVAEVAAAARNGGGFFGKVNVRWLVVWSGTWSDVAKLRDGDWEAVQEYLPVE